MKKESINNGSGSAPSDDLDMRIEERIRKMIREDPEIAALINELSRSNDEKEKNSLAAC